MTTKGFVTGFHAGGEVSVCDKTTPRYLRHVLRVTSNDRTSTGDAELNEVDWSSG